MDWFNHLVNILKVPITCVNLNSILISEAQHVKYLIKMRDEWRGHNSNLNLNSITILHHYLSKKFKLIKK
jgi:hypothetical protein